MLEHKANINAQNEDKDTPMHLAILTRQIDIIYLLLRKNCDVSIKGYMNRDCIETAEECGLKEIANYMRNYATCMKKHDSDCKHCIKCAVKN